MARVHSKVYLLKMTARLMRDIEQEEAKHNEAIMLQMPMKSEIRVGGYNISEICDFTTRGDVTIETLGRIVN